MESITGILVRKLAGEGGDGEEHFGVHIEYSDLYASVIFLTVIYAAGIASAKVFGMPSLVGEIFAGIIFGPNLLDFVPMEEAWVLLGELGLILLVLEAGIDIDLTTLKIIGTRGFLVAIFGVITTVGLGFVVASFLGYTGIEALASACVFAPTSLGIAMNVLRSSGIINTPTGQLIVAAAIIDDIIALIVLSQLQAFVGDEVSVVDIVVPLISAICFLLGGGAIAIAVLPSYINPFLDLIQRVTSKGRKQPSAGHDHCTTRDWAALAIMLALLIILLPLTKAAKASPLLGAFLAGLVFCNDSGAHHMFVSQFKRVLQWLLRIFFAAAIGFQVPILNFGSTKVIAEGFAFMICMLGKLACGLLVPNFSATKRFKKTHLRDCLVLGFSMAAEGEFAFVIAVFAVSNKLIGPDLYASLVLAVLVTTIISPFGLQRTIAYFNKKAKSDVYGRDADAELEKSIRDRRVVFYCIQTKSSPAWGLQTTIVETLNKLNLDVIDHRAWHPRQSHDVLVNEMYVKDDEMTSSSSRDDSSRKSVEERIEEIQHALSGSIHQRNAIVRVQRWSPQIASRSPGKSVTAHVVDETARALRESMVKSDELLTSAKDLEIPSGEESTTSATSGSSDDDVEAHVEALASPRHPTRRISHLDSMFAGHLDGMFRHDGVHVTDEYETILPGNAQAYSGRVGMDNTDQTLGNLVLNFLLGRNDHEESRNTHGDEGDQREFQA